MLSDVGDAESIDCRARGALPLLSSLLKLSLIDFEGLSLTTADLPNPSPALARDFFFFADKCVVVLQVEPVGHTNAHVDERCCNTTSNSGKNWVFFMLELLVIQQLWQSTRLRLRSGMWHPHHWLWTMNMMRGERSEVETGEEGKIDESSREIWESHWRWTSLHHTYVCSALYISRAKYGEHNAVLHLSKTHDNNNLSVVYQLMHVYLQDSA